MAYFHQPLERKRRPAHQQPASLETLVKTIAKLRNKSDKEKE
jgi:hypothetical protein